MIRLTRKAEQVLAPETTETTLTLTYDQRVRSRLRVLLDDGREAGLFLDRGSSLRDGDCLLSEDGISVRVRAGTETVSSARCEDPLLFARACYHLGNRHVALQIEQGRLSYPHDHVLDAMLRGLGLEIEVVQAPFEPEPGAYESGHHSQGHHAHAHPHHDH